MSRTTEIFDILKSRIVDEMGDEFGGRIVRWDGFLADLIASSSVTAQKVSLRIGVSSESNAVLSGVNKPALVDYVMSLDVFMGGVLAGKMEDHYRDLDEVTDRLSSAFYFNTGGERDWSLTGLPIRQVTRGPVVPTIAPSADYISRGFQLTLKVSVLL